MSDHTNDLRFPHLRVCREHGRLYDPAPHPESGQQQVCHSNGTQPKWVGFDYNEWVHLCESCLQDTRRSGSRYSTFFCDTCLILIKAKAPRIPKGRHSQFHGWALPPRVDAAARQLEETAMAIDALHGWSRDRVAGLIGAGAGDPDLAMVMGEARRRWDKERAVADLVAHWAPSRRR